MDHEECPNIVDLTSDSDTNKPTSIESLTPAEGGVKLLNDTKLSDGKEEHEILRKQSGSSLQRLNLSNPGDNLLKNNNVNNKEASNIMSKKISVHPDYQCLLRKTNDDVTVDLYSCLEAIMLRKNSRPLQNTLIKYSGKLLKQKGKFASKKINKTNDIQVSNTNNVNKPITLNNSSPSEAKLNGSSCSKTFPSKNADEVIIIDDDDDDDDININEDNRTTVKAKDLLSKVESKTFPSSNSKSTTLQLDEKNDRTPWNMSGKAQNILDTTQKQSIQDGLTKSKTNSNINESNNQLIKELDFDVDQMISQTSLSELYNGIEEKVEMNSFNNEQLNSLIECGSSDSNETEERMDTVGVDQADSSASGSYSIIKAFDTCPQILGSQKTFTSKDIKDTKTLTTTNQGVNHLKKSFCQSEEIDDNQSTTVSVSGIPVVQCVTANVGIKRRTSTIKPMDIKFPPCITITPIEYRGKKIMKKDEEKKNEVEDERKKIEEDKKKQELEKKLLNDLYERKKKDGKEREEERKRLDKEVVEEEKEMDRITMEQNLKELHANVSEEHSSNQLSLKRVKEEILDGGDDNILEETNDQDIHINNECNEYNERNKNIEINENNANNDEFNNGSVQVQGGFIGFQRQSIERLSKKVEEDFKQRVVEVEIQRSKEAEKKRPDQIISRKVKESEMKKVQEVELVRLKNDRIEIAKEAETKKHEKNTRHEENQRLVNNFVKQLDVNM